MKHISLALLLIFTLSLSSCLKYEDGPMFSFRSKKNRAANRIGKYWKSDTYQLKMGQEGYALSKLNVEGFIDIGNWEFDDTKSYIKFYSQDFQDFDMRILKLQHKKMKLEGAFPYDNTSIVHEFEMDKIIDDI